MAQFDFYGNDTDSLAALHALLDPGDVRVTPSLNYHTAHPRSYRGVENELLEALKINRRLFITGRFSKRPLHLEQVEGGDYSGTYVITEREGGPALSISLPMAKRLDGKICHLGPGDLFCHNVFWDDDGTEYKAPDDIKQAYVTLRKRLKSVVKRRHIGEDHVWVGDGGLKLVEEGKALILINGNWVDAEGTLVKSNVQGRKTGRNGNY